MTSAAIVDHRASVKTSLWNVVTLQNVNWETYCKLRDEPPSEHIRMAYLDGVLTLKSPEIIHDRGAELLGLVVRGVTSGLGLEVMGIRTATLRKGLARTKGSVRRPITRSIWVRTSGGCGNVR